MAYIYKIVNLINGKAYVGQTIRAPLARFKAHKYRKSKQHISAQISGRYTGKLKNKTFKAGGAKSLT